MAPAALDTYLQHMKDLKRDGTYYDLILTGDLSNYGKKIMKDLLKEENQKYNEYDDCGCLLYDITQNIYQGGSGPVCNALVSFGYIYQMILKGKYKRVLVLATGALLNPVDKSKIIYSLCLSWLCIGGCFMNYLLSFFILWFCLCYSTINLRIYKINTGAYYL